MGSRKEEERNEKIIRGLMKLPPNRRCINCNSLGPQYVCTNFWTFICITCSGIHREYTHRVKSVSMSKFTTPEVEALQNGGNQRAREIFLKDWDQQRQRLPDNSNVDKVREFIKTVYVEKRYAGGKTSDKPPRDLQRIRSSEDETRRASSYHSFSQSPPYDFQYEDRRYGKQPNMLTRKPGSDRGLYVGKMSSFIGSPTRINERIFEDRFANESSVSRVSDYSVSSGGDPVRSGAESPNCQRDIAFSPSVDGLAEDVKHQTIDLFSEANFKGDVAGIPRPQRTVSLGSIESFDSNSKSHNSGSLVDDVHAARYPQEKMSTSAEPSASSHASLDPFKATTVPEPKPSVSPPIDLFQLPAALPASSVNLFQAPPLNPSPSGDLFTATSLTPAPSFNLHQPSQTSLPSTMDLFGDAAQQQLITASDEKSSGSSMPKNEGWATFDFHQAAASAPVSENLASSAGPSDVSSSSKFDEVSSLNTSTQWPVFQNSTAIGQSSIPSPCQGDLHNFQATGNTSSQKWNAFEFDSSITDVSPEGSKQSNGPQAIYKSSSTADQYLGFGALEDSNKDVIQRAAYNGLLSGHSGPSDIIMGPSYAPPVHHLMEETQSHADHRSTNPFDLPYESDLAPSDVFLDMSSLQAALPNSHLPSNFLGGVTQPWFPQDPGMTYIPAAPQGGLSYIGGQAPSSQLANVQTQGPVASVGGNPFA